MGGFVVCLLLVCAESQGCTNLVVCLFIVCVWGRICTNNLIIRDTWLQQRGELPMLEKMTPNYKSVRLNLECTYQSNV